MLSSHMKKYRWRITALLFFATTLNYLDRSVLSILSPGLQRRYGWSEIEYGYMVTAFQAAYGIGVLFTSRWLDRYGSRIVYALAMGLWSVAGMGHALARGVFGFSMARWFLGLGESANFPAAVKTVTELFPPKERALATGIFNAGSNIGAIAAPLLVPWIALRYGWQWAFIVTGGLGLIWVVGWWSMYRRPDEGQMRPSIGWRSLLTKKETIAIGIARFLTDPVWWFLLYWLPKFLDKQYHVGLGNIGLPLVIIYVAADVGSILGGWLGRRSRRRAMLICAICALPLLWVGQATGQGLWTVITLISLAAAAHQGWAANIYTVVSDVFPENAVASVVGISTCTAVIGSTLAATVTGWVLDRTGSYSMIFTVAGCLYLAGWAVLRLLIPNERK